MRRWKTQFNRVLDSEEAHAKLLRVFGGQVCVKRVDSQESMDEAMRVMRQATVNFC